MDITILSLTLSAQLLRLRCLLFLLARVLFLPLSLVSSIALADYNSGNAEDEPHLLAFVVGINRYENLGDDQQLSRAVQDALDVGKGLEDLGFTVVGGVGTDLSRDEFRQRWKIFLSAIKPDRHDTVTIFLSGHGMAIEEKSLFLTKNAPFKRAGRQGELEREGILLSEIILDLQARRPRLGLIIIDACRTNPFIPPEFSAKGLGGVSITGDGLLVVYSAGGNETALDRLPGSPLDVARNSVFGRVLIPKLAELDPPVYTRIPLYLAWVQQLQKEVRRISNRRQTPKFYSGLEGEFCLLGDCPWAIPQALAMYPKLFDPSSCEEWEGVTGSNEGPKLGEEYLLAFIARYRGQPCTDEARRQLDKLVKQRSTVYIIAVGVGQVSDERIMRLKFAAKDARDVALVLSRQIGAAYKAVHLYQLIDEGATRQNILAKFKEVQEQAQPSDSVFVYLAGQGLDVDGSPFLIPSDGRLGDVASYLSLSEVQQFLANTAGHRMLFLDTCGTMVTKLMNAVLVERNKDDQVTVFAAALPGQVALEDSSLEHGLFTYALLRGLSGDAKDPEKNAVTIASLGNFVSRYVAARSTEIIGMRQQSSWSSSEGDFVIDY